MLAAAEGPTREAVDTIIHAHKLIPGLGHPVHKPLDPRTRRLFAIARATGFHGRHVELMKLVARRRKLPINATGAIGAICCEMALPPEACRGIGVMARAVGLVGHALEELKNPIGREVWRRTDEEASSHARGTLRRKKR